MMEFLEEIKKGMGGWGGGRRGRAEEGAVLRQLHSQRLRMFWRGEAGVSPVCRAKCGTFDWWRGSWQEGGIRRGCELGSEFPP